MVIQKNIVIRTENNWWLLEKLDHNLQVPFVF